MVCFQEKIEEFAHKQYSCKWNCVWEKRRFTSELLKTDFLAWKIQNFNFRGEIGSDPRPPDFKPDWRRRGQ